MDVYMYVVGCALYTLSHLEGLDPLGLLPRQGPGVHMVGRDAEGGGHGLGGRGGVAREHPHLCMVEWSWVGGLEGRGSGMGWWVGGGGGLGVGESVSIHI